MEAASKPFGHETLEYTICVHVIKNWAPV